MHLSTLVATSKHPFFSVSLGSAPLFAPSLGSLSLAHSANPVATRQNSTSGRPKSPRIQVVLPEDVCERLGAVAEAEARTVSNMARVLIQQGLEVYEQQQAALRAAAAPSPAARAQDTDNFRQALEQQEQAEPKRLRGAPRRLRLNRPRA